MFLEKNIRAKVAAVTLINNISAFLTVAHTYFCSLKAFVSLGACVSASAHFLSVTGFVGDLLR
jgi:hypothetical protein